MEQPIINIGMLGSVSDGKFNYCISNRYKNIKNIILIIKKNITIHLVYANMKIYNH